MNLDAKEKAEAEELVYKFFLIIDDVYNECRMHKNEAKQSALIAVDEIIRIENHHKNHKWVEYWQEVKKEIEKL